MGWIGSAIQLVAPIVLGAENLSYMKFIETHARAFLTLIKLSISSVLRLPAFVNYFESQGENTRT